MSTGSTMRDPSKTPWSPVVVLTLIVLGVAVWLIRSRSAGVPARPPVARVVARLSPGVRDQLRPRMRRHAVAMRAMTEAVMAFDDDRTARAVAALLEDPELVRPLSSEAAALAMALPPVFHDYEAALQREAQQLLGAAQAHDGERLTKAHAELTWTCAQCHAAFAGP
jgi:cytochrome c556